MRKLLCVTGVMTALIAVSQPAQANMILELSDAAFPQTVTCNNSGACGVGFTSPDAEHLSYAGTVGSFTIGLTAAISNAPGNVNEARIDVGDISITNTSGTTQTLTIDISGYGFTLPTGPYMMLNGSASQSATSVVPGGSFTSQSFADPTNTTTGGVWSVSDGTCGPVAISLSSGNCAETPVTWTRGGGPFGLRNLVTFTLGAGQTINAVSDVAATAVPEPASLLLLGSALVAASRSVRRRRQGAAV